MNPTKTRSLEEIEEKMQGMDESSLRYHILESAKNFKTSWIELGRALYSVFKDRNYKEWGFGKFDHYVSKEIGIRKQTAMKLLRSYFFLEKEEPLYLKKEYVDSAEASEVPSYEAVDVLRMAKNKKYLDSSDYANLKKEVFAGQDAHQVKKDLTQLIRQREELEPEEARQKKRLAAVKRFLSTLKSLKAEIEVAKLLPAPLLREAESLIRKLEGEIR